MKQTLLLIVWSKGGRLNRPARASEIIVSATDHDTNNGIGEDPTAQGGILTPASLTAKTQKRPRGRHSGDGDNRGDGGWDRQLE